MEALRNVFLSLVTAIRHVRVWLFAWAVVTTTAVLVVLPAWHALDAGLTHHPAATRGLDPLLDPDLWRTRPALTLELTGALVAMVAFGAFLSGGVLATVGVAGRRFRFAQLLGEGGFLWMRTVRVLGVGLVAALLLGWGADAFGAWLVDRLRDVDPGDVAVSLGFVDVRWIHVLEAIAWLRGLVFVGLLFTTKIALARAVEPDARSAVAAFVAAVGHVLRRPIRAALIVLGWVVVWAGGSHLIGLATARLLEVDGQLLAGFAVGQLGVVLGQWVLIGLLLSARRFRAVSVARA